MSPNASHRVRPGLSSAASLITTLLISFDQEVLNQHLNLVTPEYPFFESPCGVARVDRKLVQAAMTMGVSRPAILSRVVLPAALPSILLGARLAMGVAWTAI